MARTGADHLPGSREAGEQVRGERDVDRGAAEAAGGAVRSRAGTPQRLSRFRA